MKKSYLLLVFFFLLLCVFTACDKPQAEPKVITITLNSGILELEDSTVEAKEGEKVTLPSGDVLWNSDEHTFSGWALTENGEVEYMAGDKYTPSSGVTLYARWKEIEVSKELDFTLYGDAFSVKVSGTAISGDVSIPGKYRGKTVTSIGDYGFTDCKNLTSVTIPKSVTAIGKCAFLDCTGLGSITIPDSVTSIGSHAFSGCSVLTAVTYQSTKTEWESISKTGWNTGASITVIKCTDGDISLSD